jgi:hypothetical protein
MTTKGKNTFFRFYCSCCKQEHEDFFYDKRRHYFPVTLCCNSLVCEGCYQSRTALKALKFKCNICARQIGLGVRNKLAYKTSNEWIECYEAYKSFYSSIKGKFNCIIPLLTKNGFFKNCEKLGVLLSDDTSEFEVQYQVLVCNFYTRMFLFYSLLSAKMRKNFLSFKTSPRKLEFFKLMRDMAFFSNHSRKKILRWGLNGFNYFILDKLSQGDKSLSCVKKKEFLVMLLRIVLAKKNPKL